jgi:nucleotide-binding universal stress UspA family protein
MKRIVVGIDCSDHSAAALRWAAEVGTATGAEVVAVMAWSYLDQRHRDGSTGFDPKYSEADVQAEVEAFVTQELGDGAGSVTIETPNALPSHALIDASESADLVVVGSRGLGGFKGLLVGSVSKQVLEHARCSVTLVRPSA